ncbi:CRISPR-associated helicase Cas3' [Neptuniibacter sp. QD37_11]|uniref:CRISPR-associated helicase Cas3' n=1 Tax=Neptuniibacter sp. QD37_11 TaxID=3398209 RepID=UPI0039F5DA28
MNIIANTSGHSLPEHLANVGLLSSALIKALGVTLGDFTNDKLSKMAMYAGILHDIGKIDPDIQQYFAEKSVRDEGNGSHHYPTKAAEKKHNFQSMPRHNEISYYLINQFCTDRRKLTGLNVAQTKMVMSVALWHHAKPIRREPLTYNSIANYVSARKEAFKAGMTYLNTTLPALIGGEVSVNFDVDDDNFEPLGSLPGYKEAYQIGNFVDDMDIIRNHIQVESICSLLRTTLITADRLVSSGVKIESPDDAAKLAEDVLAKHTTTNLTDYIAKMEAYPVFTQDAKRAQRQATAAEALSKIDGVSVLNGPAGSGKTKISLSYTKEIAAKKIYYVTPRTVICQGLFEELTSQYLPEGVSIELATGADKRVYMGDKQAFRVVEDSEYRHNITITTIDQLAKTITTHGNVDLLLDVLTSTLVFDEYHEFYNLSGYNLLFSEIIELKKALPRYPTLLMSATPNYFFLERVLELYHPRSSTTPVVNFKTFNEVPYRIELTSIDESDTAHNPITKAVECDKKTIIISNSATTAQLGYMRHHENEPSLLAHSKYPNAVKNQVFREILRNFGDLSPADRSVLRSGPIVQASLNITSHHVITELSTPENVLQRLGRCNRYGEDFEAQFTLCLPKGVGLNGDKTSIKGPILHTLHRSHELHAAVHWAKFLSNELTPGKPATLDELYTLYQSFYQQDEVIAALEGDAIKALRESYANITYNVLDPVEIIGTKRKTKTKKNAKNSLRGVSHYAHAAVFTFGDNSLEATGDYSPQFSVNKEVALLYKENYELVNDFKRYAHQLDETKYNRKQTKQMNEKTFLNLSLSDEFPLFLSFTPDDLRSIGQDENNESSIIYVQTKRQDVGFLSLSTISKS